MPTLPAIVAPNTPAATPGLVPGTGTPTAGGGFGFEALLALLLGVGPVPAADAPADDAKAGETAGETAGAAAAGALAAGAQAASATAVSGEVQAAANAGEAATGKTPVASSTATTASVTTAQVTQGKAEVPPTKSEGGTLGSRAVAGVVAEENAGVPLPEQGVGTGKGAAPSAPSDLPSKAQVIASEPAAAAVPADGAAAALRTAEHPKVDAPADGASAERPHPVNALGGADAVALQASHAGTHHEAGGDARHDGTAPQAAPAEAPAPPAVPFHAPPRDASHADAARLDPPAPRAPEPPEPPHTAGPRSEMRLEVSADDLGKVEVRVVVRDDGVHATLVAPQDQAREALTQHRAALEDALNRAQLRLDGFTVGAGPNDGRQQQERFDRSGLPTAIQAGVPIGLAAASASTPAVAESTAGKGLSLRA